MSIRGKLTASPSVGFSTDGVLRGSTLVNGCVLIVVFVRVVVVVVISILLSDVVMNCVLSGKIVLLVGVAVSVPAVDWE